MFNSIQMIKMQHYNEYIGFRGEVDATLGRD